MSYNFEGLFKVQIKKLVFANVRLISNKHFGIKRLYWIILKMGKMLKCKSSFGHSVYNNYLPIFLLVVKIN